MRLGLEGKIALVAAASRGLGRAIAEELAAEGASIVLCARGEQPLRAAHEAIGASGAAVASVVADLATSDGVARVARAALDRFGRVDVLVNNAGGPPSGPFESHDWSAWERAVALNLRSAVELTRAVLPGMRERKWGRIINVTSIAVKQPVESLILSNSVRAAVTGFARTLANEVARDGITVNNILPGWTRTERVVEIFATRAEREHASPAELEERTAAEIPMHRLGEPRELAALAAFLASDRASYITAQNIAVDGGWIRGLL